MGSQVVPRFVVLKALPEATATYQVARSFGIDRHVGDAAGAGGGADAAELQAGEQVLVDRRRFLRARCRGGQEGGGERETGERTVAHGEISYGRYRVVGSDIMEAQG